ncbi:MAG TPA: hypothetical protein VGD19_06545 [Allosphingosinicella sp.]|jgi:hypothetical protein
MLKRVAALSLAAAAAGCMSYMDDDPPPAGPSMQTVRAEARLAQELRDKRPGRPQSCITRFEADRMSTVGDRTIVFRASPGLVYVNEPAGGCPMEGASRRLERRTIDTNLCRNEQLNVIDNATGAYFGTCILGDFVPYRSR